MLVVALTALVAANTIAIDAKNAIVVGHVARENNAPVLHWPASEIRARFQGTSVAIVVDERPTHDPGVPAGDTDRIVAFVDGTRFDLAPRAGESTITIANGLKAGEHEIDVVKRTEPLVGDIVVKAFVVDALLDPPKQRAHRIEIVGDSLGTGYGITGKGPQCPFSADTEDFTKSMAGLVATKFDADLVDVAWSGRGVYRDIDGRIDVPTMPALWLETNRKAPLDREPDVVVVELGANDLLNDNPERAPFFAAYEALLDGIRASYPKAELILATPMAWSTSPTDFVTVTGFAWLNAIMHKRGDMKISLAKLPGRDDALGLGCTWHPSPKMHQKLAAPVIDAVHARTHW